MKRFLSLILILCFALSLCACGKADKGYGVTVTTGENDAPAKTLSLLNDAGKAAYTILSYSTADEIVASATSLLSAELKEKTGVKFTITYDYGQPKDDTKSLEFLIGDTERKESIALSEGIGENEYRVKVVGNKIVAVGGSSLALARGVGALLAAIDFEGNTLPGDLNIVGTVGGHSDMLVGMCNQTTNTIEVFDISMGRMDATSIVWSCKAPTSAISGFKLRNYEPYGDVVLITGGVTAAIVDYDTKETIWYTNNAPENSHSIELMPNGVIAVGGTVGHDIHFYNLNGDDPTKVLFEMPHHDAHGVLWDEENQVLYGAGSAMLYAYTVTLNADGTVDVVKDEDKSVTMPDTGAHDLQPYFGDTNLLLVTSSKYVYIYDKTTKEFTDALEGVKGAVRKSVKGIGIYPNGDMIYIYPDGLQELWCSTILNYVKAGEERVSVEINAASGRFYKCRVWMADYQ